MQTFVESITYPNAVAYVKVSDLLKRYREQHPGYRRSLHCRAKQPSASAWR